MPSGRFDSPSARHFARARRGSLAIPECGCTPALPANHTVPSVGGYGRPRGARGLWPGRLILQRKLLCRIALSKGSTTGRRIRKVHAVPPVPDLVNCSQAGPSSEEPLTGQRTVEPDSRSLLFCWTGPCDAELRCRAAGLPCLIELSSVTL